MLERLFPQQADDKLFVEDVFSTTLYSGTGSFRGINVGISNFAVAGGMVWMKSRNSGTFGNEIHRLYDTARASSGGGGTLVCSPSLQSNSADLNFSGSSVTFYSTGTTITVNGGNPNNSGYNYASWSFRKAPKFFDVVTYTGDGTSQRLLNHSLGVAPGFIVVKRLDTTSNWWTYHRGVAGSINGYLNLTDAFSSTGYLNVGNIIFGQDPASIFRVFNSGSGNDLNVSGATYVAYLYAHDATSDGLIQCGSFTTDGSGYAPQVTLGWEPQWVMFKRANSSTFGSWQIVDTMRGWVNNGSAADDYTLFANLSNSEGSAADRGFPTATGFNVGYTGAVSSEYIYVAIRRGPMRTPTLGTSVFSPVYATSASSPYTVTTNFPVDLVISTDVSGSSKNTMDRLRGGTTTSYAFVNTNSTLAESTGSSIGIGFQNNTAVVDNSYWSGYGLNVIYWNFRRAPGFMDVVCYTGTGTIFGSVTHGLGVKPELLICKNRTTSENWYVQYQNPVSGVITQLRLNTNEGDLSGGGFNGHLFPTYFYVWNNGSVLQNNTAGSNYVAYLFASVPGVSKVGSYTGNGSSQTINCAFTTGARFVLIKRTDSTGDWWVWDTARGIVSANDPALRLNSTAAETTGIDSVDPDSTGFVVNQDSTTNINVNAATYIFLAIA
jgi:hypothetical protein